MRQVRRLVCAALIALVLYPLILLGVVYREVWTSGLPGGGNGPADAYRHTLASALVAYTLSPRAVDWLTWWTEERHQPMDTTNLMDAHNNRLGARIGYSSRSIRDVLRRVKTAVELGQLDAPSADCITWLPPRMWQNNRFF